MSKANACVPVRLSYLIVRHYLLGVDHREGIVSPSFSLPSAFHVSHPLTVPLFDTVFLLRLQECAAPGVLIRQLSPIATSRIRVAVVSASIFLSPLSKTLDIIEASMIFRQGDNKIVGKLDVRRP